MFFGKNTKWCTAAKNDNRFDSYNKGGPLYVVLIKRKNQRYQFHFQTNQFMDEQDDPINPRELADQYPILWKIFEPISAENKSIILTKNPTEQQQLAAVEKNADAIKYIPNPSTTVQLITVKKNIYNYTFIKYPSEEVNLYCIEHYPNDLPFIKNPSRAVQMRAVELSQNALRGMPRDKIHPDALALRKKLYGK